MAVSTKIIKRRIKSVANTRKITKAMELVAGAKMRKSVQLTMMSRDYARTIKILVESIHGMVDPSAHPLLAGHVAGEGKKNAYTLVVVAAADRGLCGGFNSQVLKKALDFLKTRGPNVKVVTVGKRAETTVKRAGYDILAAFEAISNAPSFERTVPVGTFITQEFLNGSAERVFIVSMDFKSAMTQIPEVKQLLPIIPEDELVEHIEATEEDRQSENAETEILFEPDPQTVLNTLLPRLLETIVYQCLLESSASEHSARMLAMRNATENASEMLEDLSFTFNQARQATITREIAEISAGKAVIE